ERLSAQHRQDQLRSPGPVLVPPGRAFGGIDSRQADSRIPLRRGEAVSAAPLFLDNFPGSDGKEKPHSSEHEKDCGRRENGEPWPPEGFHRRRNYSAPASLKYFSAPGWKGTGTDSFAVSSWIALAALCELWILSRFSNIVLVNRYTVSSSISRRTTSRFMMEAVGTSSLFPYVPLGMVFSA